MQSSMQEMLDTIERGGDSLGTEKKDENGDSPDKNEGNEGDDKGNSNGNGDGAGVGGGGDPDPDEGSHKSSSSSSSLSFSSSGLAGPGKLKLSKKDTKRLRKLNKNLLASARLAKVAVLRMDSVPKQRRMNFNQFVDGVRPILQSSGHLDSFLSETGSDFKRSKKPFVDRALYNLIVAHVDAEGEEMTSDVETGCDAFESLRPCCAQTTSGNAHQHDNAFKLVKHRQGKAAGSHIGKFRRAKKLARSVNKTHTRRKNSCIHFSTILMFLANVQRPRHPL